MAAPVLPASGERRRRPPIWTRRQNLVLLILAGALAAVALVRLSLENGWGTAAVTIDEAGRADIDPRLDVNAASWPSLARLPALGAKTAKAIVAEREANGAFRDGADLIVRVRGIGPATYAKFRDHIRFVPDTRPAASR